MVNYFIYAKEFSFSTDGDKYYHRNCLKTLDQFKKDVQEIKEGLLIAGEPPTESKIIYLHGAYRCCEVDEQTIRKTYKSQVDNDYELPRPATITNWLKEHDIFDNKNKIKLLYLTTDGMNYNVIHKRILRDDIVEEKVHLNDYVHLMYFKDKSFYMEAIDSLEDDQVLSLHKLFIGCVEASRENPTLAKYFMYVLKRKKFHEDLVTLFPSNVLFEMKDMHECYQKVVKKVGVEEFLEVCDPRFMRMKRNCTFRRK
ncbi:hypothetical protein KQX54_016931 [Cotesia glomerata]|uniref:Uncharacterized protein n=1 Tax=Cotesia glomerata TaxID=32391 RepID=A0AAV7I8N7_COTGL|nr:hypothetical protein KQX54_016931 [Cotesia glomerata]